MKWIIEHERYGVLVDYDEALHFSPNKSRAQALQFHTADEAVRVLQRRNKNQRAAFVRSWGH
jgi:hypothetical protein